MGEGRKTAWGLCVAAWVALGCEASKNAGDETPPAPDATSASPDGSSDASDAAPEAGFARPTTNPPPVPGGCSEVTAVCLLPFPDSRLERPDPATPTGLRVDLPAELAIPTVWSRLSVEPADGFSPVGTLATWLPGPAVELPAAPEGTTGPDSPILLLDADATAPTWGEALPWRASQSTEAEGGGRVLFLSPLRALRPGGRYAVLVDRRVLAGGAAEPTEGMAAKLRGEDPYARDLVALAQHAGRAPGDVLQLWDFHVRSAEGIRRNLDALATANRAVAEALAPPAPVNPQPGEHGVTRYDVALKVPRWREDTFAPIHRDAEGRPEPLGDLELTAILVVPANATPERPAIPILFGHGLSASAELMYAQLVPMLDLEAGPYALLMPDWDLHGTRGQGLQDILAIAGRLDGTAFAHSLLQSAADAFVFSAALAKMGPLPERGAVIRPGPVYFLGQSLGSMIGFMGAGLDPNVRAAVFNVGGGALSSVLREGGVVERLGLKDAIQTLVEAEPPAGLTVGQAVEVVMAMSQIAFDVGDPAALAAAGVAPTTPYILQESLGDGIVVNAATEMMARTLELPLVLPVVQPVVGLETVEAPTLGRPDRAMTQFRVAKDGFQAHLALNFGAVQTQAMHFFASYEDADPDNDGDIAYDCRGDACDYVGE